MVKITKVVLIIEYDGTAYHGFQLQLALPTIQQEIEKAICELTGERVRVLASSRTDSGVHARGQVVSFRTGSPLAMETFVSGFNHYLPDDIAVKAAYRVDGSFDVRRQAISREYKYYVWNSLTRSPTRRGFCHFVTGCLDVEAMNHACQAISGKHDFISFASAIEAGRKNTVRRVYRAEVERDGEMVVFSIVANSFLTHQVRNTMGALIRVGLGKMRFDEFCSIMEVKKPGLAGPVAPAYGLCLEQVNYPRSFGEEI